MRGRANCLVQITAHEYGAICAIQNDGPLKGVATAQRLKLDSRLSTKVAAGETRRPTT